MKGLEALKEMRKYGAVMIPNCEIIEKELNAFEIIRNKNVFVWGFIHRQEEIDDFKPTYDYYKSHYGYFHSGYDCDKYLLTKEEYELLKEILL